MTSGRSVLLQTLASPLAVLIGAASLWVLFRGHHAPGGGFIAGLVAALGLVVREFGRLAAGLPPREVGRSLSMAAIGVLVTALSGVPATLAGDDYLRNQPWSLDLGVVSLPITTVLVFDLGVSLCVLGAVGGTACRLLPREDAEGEERRP